MTRPLRVLLVHPGATMAVSDVFDGLAAGLVSHGVHVEEYRLDKEINGAHAELNWRWRKLRKENPDFPKPNKADVLYRAGVPAVEMALRKQVDVVIVVSAMFVLPDVITLMKRAGLPVTVLFTESPYNYDDEMRIAKMVDGCWTHERSTVAAFRTVNKCVGYLPHAWNPDRHGVIETAHDTLRHDVVFVGTGFRERVAWFNAIDWTGVDLGLYGTWKNLGLSKKIAWHENVPNDVAAALYRKAKIGLNLYRTSKGWGRKAPSIDHAAESLNPRAYELAACGAFHLSDHRSEVKEVFGDLVPTFSSPSEASALIRLWLKDADERARVASQLPACVAESSWTQRAATVLGDLSRLIQHQAA